MPAASIAMHKIHCARNISKCTFCGRAVLAREVASHVDTERGTPVSFGAAAAAGNLPGLEAMLLHGASPTAAVDTSTRDTPLHVAARHRRCAVISLLLARGCPVNVANAGGETPLHAACASQDAAAGDGGAPAGDALGDVVTLLVRGGCDVEARTVLGDTPMQVAQRCRNVDVLLLLATSGGGLRPVRARQPRCSGPRARARVAYTRRRNSRDTLSRPAPPPTTRRQAATAASRDRPRAARCAA
jgi:hypothetical protein